MSKRRSRSSAAVKPRHRWGSLVLLLAVLAAAVILVPRLHTLQQPALGVTVCLDAGHGGYDTGCTVDELKESEQNLSLALAVQQEMERRGITVILTRSDDTYISLEERAELANSAGADYFISLHRNSAAAAEASGIEIWYSSAASETTKVLAAEAEAALVEAGVSNDRGAHSGSQSDPNEDYAVCRLTQMPAILIEMGFMTSSEDNGLFLSNQQVYAKALADAVVSCWEQSQSGS